MKLLNKNRNIITGCFTLLVVIAAMAFPAAAYATNGYWWHAEYAEFDVDSSVPDEWWSALNSAMDEWNDAPSDFYYDWDSGSTTEFKCADLPQETWNAQCQPYTLSSDNTAISRMIITFNTDKTWYYGSSTSCPSGSMDVQSTATHELGHALGLGHSTYSSATMWPYGYTGTTWKRSLYWDDENGVRAIYGSD